jgi:hypothetical protein
MNMVMEPLALLLLIYKNWKFKNLDQRLVIQKEEFKLFTLVIPSTGYEARPFNIKSWVVILTNNLCLSA